MPNDVITATDAWKWAEQESKKLKAQDFDGLACVYVTMHDGTTFFLKDSFTTTYGDYLIIFTEHFRFQVHHKDEVANAYEMKITRWPLCKWME